MYKDVLNKGFLIRICYIKRMIIICPSWKKKFEIEDALIPDKGRLLKCGSCNETWFFNKNKQSNLNEFKEIFNTENIIKDEPLKQKNKNISFIDSNKLYNNNSRLGNKLLKGDLKVSNNNTIATRVIIETKI